jgi:hypothetical protein
VELIRPQILFHTELGVDDYPLAGAGRNRPLLFVIARLLLLVIASPDLSGRGNLIG